MALVAHVLSDVDEATRTAVCSECGSTRVTRSTKSKVGWRCSTPDRERYAAARANDLEGDRARRRTQGEKDKAVVRTRALKKKFELTPEDYDALVAYQDGKCPICLDELPPDRGGYVDHDHGTGLVRGILDRRCNMGLGYFDDDSELLARAIAYLNGCPSGIVGVIEIAERLGFPERTVHQWVFRDVLPPFDYASINGSRAWNWVTILRWAGATDRLRTPAAQKAFAQLRPALPSEQKSA